MHTGLLDALFETVQSDDRKQDRFDPSKYKYVRAYDILPAPYTHMVVVVKFGWQGNPPETNNFVLTAYLIEKW